MATRAVKVGGRSKAAPTVEERNADSQYADRAPPTSGTAPLGPGHYDHHLPHRPGRLRVPDLHPLHEPDWPGLFDEGASSTARP